MLLGERSQTEHESKERECCAPSAPVAGSDIPSEPIILMPIYLQCGQHVEGADQCAVGDLLRLAQLHRLHQHRPAQRLLQTAGHRQRYGHRTHIPYIQSEMFPAHFSPPDTDLLNLSIG